MIRIFTINDVFPVHFSNQQNKSVNHILVPIRGSTAELKVTTRKGGDKGTWLGSGFF